MNNPRLIPGLTTTKPLGIPAFLRSMETLDVKTIALFPTCLDRIARYELYDRISMIGSVRIPHVHLRSDCGEDEIRLLKEQFGTEVFNIHPRASTHPFGPIPQAYRDRIFVENVDIPADPSEVAELGGLCPDFSHLENAALFGKTEYVNSTMEQLGRYPVGCCHLSAIRKGVPNEWSGEWDHHAFSELKDLDFILKYRAFLPHAWASLELENRLEDQLGAIAYLEDLLGLG